MEEYMYLLIKIFFQMESLKKLWMMEVLID